MNVGVCVEDEEKTLARQETLLANLYQLQKNVSDFKKKLNELKSIPSAAKEDHMDMLNVSIPQTS